MSSQTAPPLSFNQSWGRQRMQQAEPAQTLGGKLARRHESRMNTLCGFTSLA